jgi:Rrf2 family protein
MKLTQASRYAIHALAYMATQKHNRPIASHHIAQEQGIPELFLLKVLHPLVSARVLQSIKGPNGGYRLARPAADISLLEVVEAVDGPMRGHVSFSPDETDQVLNQRLDKVCTKAVEEVRKELQKVKVSELVGKGRR